MGAAGLPRGTRPAPHWAVSVAQGTRPFTSHCKLHRFCSAARQGCPHAFHASATSLSRGERWFGGPAPAHPRDTAMCLCPLHALARALEMNSEGVVVASRTRVCVAHMSLRPGCEAAALQTSLPGASAPAPVPGPRDARAVLLSSPRAPRAPHSRRPTRPARWPPWPPALHTRTVKGC